MADPAIESLLQQIIGLKVTTIGRSALDRAVQKRMRALRFTDDAAYTRMVHSSADELRELIEEVVIPETWFFRDREPFRALIDFLMTRWLPNHKNAILRILSAPCSSGEEPYSLAMTLCNSGLSFDRFSIHGIDISQRAIDRARKGVYTDHSFRGADLTYRANFFTRSNDGYIINKTIREKVYFQAGNILNSLFMESLGLFDVIFSRNVLIYLDAHSRDNTISTLHSILADDGILFVGHAEATILTDSPFAPAPYSQAFAFCKRVKPEPEKSTKPDATESRPVVKRQIPAEKKQSRRVKARTVQQQPDLHMARQLADRGNLENATTICQSYLDLHGPSAQAYFLLGIIMDAADDAAQAENFFRKTLYLDPNHEEALVFLSLLAEKRGDANKARNLQERIARLRKNSVSKQSGN